MFLGHLDLLGRPECPCRISEGPTVSGQYSVWFWFGNLEQLCADLKKKKSIPKLGVVTHTFKRLKLRQR